MYVLLGMTRVKDLAPKYQLTTRELCKKLRSKKKALFTNISDMVPLRLNKENLDTLLKKEKSIFIDQVHYQEFARKELPESYESLEKELKRGINDIFVDENVKINLKKADVSPKKGRGRQWLEFEKEITKILKQHLEENAHIKPHEEGSLWIKQKNKIVLNARPLAEQVNDRRANFSFFDKDKKGKTYSAIYNAAKKLKNDSKYMKRFY